MIYLITVGPDTDEEYSFEADEEEYKLILASLGDPHGAYFLGNGEAILLRRADYLETELDKPALTRYGKARSKGHLTLIQGGNTHG